MFILSARASGIEILHFYGFGNVTTQSESEDYYKVRQEQYSVEPAFRLSASDAISVTGGPTFKVSFSRQNQDCIIGDLNPYGSDRFAQVGLFTKFVLDSKKRHSKDEWPLSGYIMLNYLTLICCQYQD